MEQICRSLDWGRVNRQGTQHFIGACASRQVGNVPANRCNILAEEAIPFGKNIFGTFSPHSVRHGYGRIGTQQSSGHFPSTSMQHCQFLGIQSPSTPSYAKRDQRKGEPATHGAMLYACIELLEREPSGSPISHDTHRDSPALTSWLRTFHRSCTLLISSSL